MMFLESSLVEKGEEGVSGAEQMYCTLGLRHGVKGLVAVR